MQWQEPQELFVPASNMTGNALLMADGLHARGLMLSAVRCLHTNGGFYAYLMPMSTGSRTWEGLVNKFARSCVCGACWECCQLAALQAGMQK
jgi:hypothetical protein